MGNTCIFCGGTPTTLEHVFSPKWIAALMPDTTSWTSELYRRDDDGAAERRQWVNANTPKSRAGAPAMRCACSPCNNGWMQELDTKARPALTPLGLGEAGTVSAHGVRLIAAWAAKVATVLDSALPNGELIDREVKESFRKTLQPPASWTVWAAAMSPSSDSTRVNGQTLVRDPAGGEPLAYVATFRIVHLVAQVFCALRDDVVFLRTGGWGQRVVRVWPNTARLRWPPPESTWLTSEAEFEALAQAVAASRP